MKGYFFEKVIVTFSLDTSGSENNEVFSVRVE